MLKTFRDIREFQTRTGVFRFFTVPILDIQPDMIGGCFFYPRLGELIAYCAANSDLHIISCPGGDGLPCLFNRVIDEASFYLLGDGDKDPNLACVPLYDLAEYLDLQVTKHWHDQ